MTFFRSWFNKVFDVIHLQITHTHGYIGNYLPLTHILHATTLRNHSSNVHIQSSQTY